MRTPILLIAGSLLLGACAPSPRVVYVPAPSPEPAPAPAPVADPVPETVPSMPPVGVTIVSSDQSRLLISTNQPAYLAVFEIVPYRGVTLVYPTSPRERQYTVSGSRWVNVWWRAQRRGYDDDRYARDDRYDDRDSRGDRYRSSVHYVYAIASDRPLRLPEDAFDDDYLRDLLGYRAYEASDPYETMHVISQRFVTAEPDEEWGEDVYTMDVMRPRMTVRIARVYCAGGYVFEVRDDMADVAWCPTRGRGRTGGSPSAWTPRPDSVVASDGQPVRRKFNPGAHQPLFRVPVPTDVHGMGPMVGDRPENGGNSSNGNGGVASGDSHDGHGNGDGHQGNGSGVGSQGYGQQDDGHHDNGHHYGWDKLTPRHGQNGNGHGNGNAGDDHGDAGNDHGDQGSGVQQQGGAGHSTNGNSGNAYGNGNGNANGNSNGSANGNSNGNANGNSNGRSHGNAYGNNGNRNGNSNGNNGNGNGNSGNGADAGTANGNNGQGATNGSSHDGNGHADAGNGNGHVDNGRGNGNGRGHDQGDNRRGDAANGQPSRLWINPIAQQPGRSEQPVRSAPSNPRAESPSSAQPRGDETPRPAPAGLMRRFDHASPAQPNAAPPSDSPAPAPTRDTRSDTGTHSQPPQRFQPRRPQRPDTTSDSAARRGKPTI